MRTGKKMICVLMAVMVALSGCQGKGSGEREETRREEKHEEKDRNENDSLHGEEDSEKREEEHLREERTEAKPITIDISAEYIGEWDRGQQIIQGSSSRLRILDEGYEDFQAVLDAYGEEIWGEVQDIYQEYLPEAMSRFAESGYADYEISRTIHLERADSRIVSFTDAESSYLGGAHGSYYTKGVNFDPVSGNLLSLGDVVADYDKVYEYAKEYLEREYGKEAFFADYQDTLRDMFYGSPEGLNQLQWTMNTEKVFLHFSQYVLGPYAAGAFMVEMPFVLEGQQMVKEEYVSDGKGRVERIWEWTEVPVEVNGESKTLYYTVQRDDRNYSSILSIRWGQQTVEQEQYGSFVHAYLFQKADGKAWLYVEYQEDNDWRTVYVYDLNQEVPVCVGNTGNYIGEHLVADPEHFILCTHMDVLGTYTAFRYYRVGEDGMPEVIDRVYTIINYDRGWGEYAITSKVELPVQMYADGGIRRTQEFLPAGTKFYLRRTDGETFVEMELEDGRRCDILIERDGYFSRIHGMSEDECFEGLQYAG